MAPNGRVVRVQSAEDVDRVRDIVAASARAGGRGLSEHKRLDLARGEPARGSDGTCTWIGFVALDDDGKAVAYAHVSPHGSTGSAGWGLEICGVTDAAAGKHGERLVGAALDAVAGEGGGTVQWWVVDPAAADDQRAARLGAAGHRDLLRMEAPLPRPPGAGSVSSLLAGVTMRSFRPGADDDAWLKVNQRAFADHPEQGGWDGEALAARVGEAWFDPSGFLVAEVDAAPGTVPDAAPGGGGRARLAGFCWTKQHDRGVGEIYVIGVDPDHRGTGLGRVLVEAGLASLAERGSSTGMLYVDASNMAAVGLYRSLGFEVVSTQRAYQIEIGSASA